MQGQIKVQRLQFQPANISGIGGNMGISTIKGLYRYVKQNSGFTGHTVHSVILSLGYNLWGTENEFKELSGNLVDCSKHGADCGFSGFTYYSDTIKFFKKHRQDIVSHMEQTAAECGTNIISMVQNFGIFRNSEMPSVEFVGKALWDCKKNIELDFLYNAFAWYALEEISRTWYRYIEEHPALAEKLSA